MKTKINCLIWLALALIILPAISFSDSRPNQMVWNKDGTEMAYIPAGSFEMGDHDRLDLKALPVHTVELDAFYMDVNEVTVSQFKQFVQQKGYKLDAVSKEGIMHLKPDLFIFDDGSPVDANSWFRRRQELANIIIPHEFGGMPPGHESIDIIRRANSRILD